MQPGQRPGQIRPNAKCQIPQSKVQSPKSKVQNPKFKVQSTKHKAQSSKYKAQSPKSKVQSSKNKAQSTKFWMTFIAGVEHRVAVSYISRRAEGSHNGSAAVLKTAGRKAMQVRVLSPPPFL